MPTKPPGPKTRLSEWSVLDDDVRAVMLVRFAKYLRVEPQSLPRPSDRVLWVGYKKAAKRKPHIPLSVGEQLWSRLSFGDFYALYVGVEHDCPSYPAGRSTLEIYQAATGLCLADWAHEFLAECKRRARIANAQAQRSWLISNARTS